MKSAHSVTIVCSVAVAALTAQPAGPAITDPEAYAVYAAAMPLGDPSFQRPPAITVQIETLPGPSDCPREDLITGEWRGAFDDYRRQNETTKFIRPGFDLGIRYSLVPLFEIVQALKDDGLLGADGNRSPTAPRTNAPGWRVFQRLPGHHLILLSAVGFNSDRTRAMVAVQKDCIVPADGHGFCHDIDVTGLTKRNGRWDTAGGIGCHGSA